MEGSNGITLLVDREGSFASKAEERFQDVILSKNQQKVERKMEERRMGRGSKGINWGENVEREGRKKREEKI